MKFLSVLGFLIMVAGILTLIFTWTAVSWSIPAGVIQLCAFALMVWARITLGRRSFHAKADPTEGGLVTTGPYRYFRHPIYAAVLYFVIGAAIGRPSLITISAVPMVLAGALIRMLCEEKLVVKKYPEYIEYAKKTKRIIPYVF